MPGLPGARRGKIASGQEARSGAGKILIKAALLIAGGLYLVVALAMFLGQRQLMYFPDTQRADPGAAGLQGVVERVLHVEDGVVVIAWYGHAQPGQPTLLYFHGNAGSLATRSERIRKYMARGRGIYMMSYRGYSGSSGSPSEAANVADARRAFDDLVSEGVAPRDIIIYGESLGSGIAVQVAAVTSPGGLILDAPYTSIAELAASQYPWLPVRPMMFDRYESASHIGRVHCPLLIIHGEKDDVIPVAMGRALFDMANEPKSIVTFPNANHADHFMYGSYEAINGWIDKVRSGASG